MKKRNKRNVHFTQWISFIVNIIKDSMSHEKQVLAFCMMWKQLVLTIFFSLWSIIKVQNTFILMLVYSMFYMTSHRVITNIISTKLFYLFKQIFLSYLYYYEEKCHILNFSLRFFPQYNSYTGDNNLILCWNTWKLKTGNYVQNTSASAEN